MTTERKTTSIRYDEGCLAAHALNLIGDRWALLVVRELMFAPKRFQMIRAGMPGITASVLTARLAQLRRAAVIDRSEEHTSELQSLMRISYAVFCLKKKKKLIYIKQIYVCYQ